MCVFQSEVPPSLGGEHRLLITEYGFGNLRRAGRNGRAGARVRMNEKGRRWRSNPSGKCSQERLTRNEIPMFLNENVDKYLSVPRVFRLK